MNKLLAATFCLTTATAAVHAQELTINRAGTQASAKGPAANFTGAVRVDPLAQASAPARVGAAYVTFAPGARSAWHSHPLGQTLVVTSGVGRVQQWARTRRRSARATSSGHHRV